MLPTVRNSRRNQNYVPSIFNDLFDDFMFPAPAKQFASPAVNIRETEKEYDIEVAAPGMTREDFNISITNDDELVIALEKKANEEKKDEKEGSWLRREFSYSSYRQSFALPEDVNLEEVGAKMENGVLMIALPKKVETKTVPATRNITIQ